MEKGNVYCLSPQIMIPTNETLLSNKLLGDHIGVDIDTMHGKKTKQTFENEKYAKQDPTRSSSPDQPRPMKRYYPTNCPEAILMNKRGRIDSPFVDTQKAMLQYILHIW